MYSIKQVLDFLINYDINDFHTSAIYKKYLFIEAQHEGISIDDFNEAIRFDTQLNIGEIWAECCITLLNTIKKTRHTKDNIELCFEMNDLLIKLIPNDEAALLTFKNKLIYLLAQYTKKSSQDAFKFLVEAVDSKLEKLNSLFEKLQAQDHFEKKNFLAEAKKYQNSFKLYNKAHQQKPPLDNHKFLLNLHLEKKEANSLSRIIKICDELTAASESFYEHTTKSDHYKQCLFTYQLHIQSIHTEALSYQAGSQEDEFLQLDCGIPLIHISEHFLLERIKERSDLFIDLYKTIKHWKQELSHHQSDTKDNHLSNSESNIEFMQKLENALKHPKKSINQKINEFHKILHDGNNKDLEESPYYKKAKIIFYKIYEFKMSKGHFNIFKPSNSNDKPIIDLHAQKLTLHIM